MLTGTKLLPLVLGNICIGGMFVGKAYGAHKLPQGLSGLFISLSQQQPYPSPNGPPGKQNKQK